jgi:23S rRNA (cytidine2498-2'-O)-methyltransferase
MERVLLTCAPASERLLAAELELLFPRLPPLRWLGAGVALAEADAGFRALAAEVQRLQPIFLRHLAPAQVEVRLQSALKDLQTLAASVETLSPRFASDQTFAVQTRLLPEGRFPYRAADINQTLAERLAHRTGAILDARAPKQIVSILCAATVAYLGLSRTEQNRSAWPGGEQRFRREEGQISRAEFKLLEALSAFGLRLPERGTALDLGAAPGGWTRVLRERGLRVVAVDPGELDARLRGDRGVTAVQKRVQEFLPCRQRFTLLVNDLRMDALESVEIMRRAASCLKPGGLAVMTLKLPEAAADPQPVLETLGRAQARLAVTYRILERRQLFHNRSEVTIALQRRAIEEEKKA